MSNDSSNQTAGESTESQKSAPLPRTIKLPWGSVDSILVAIGSYFVAQVLGVLFYQYFYLGSFTTEALAATNTDLFLLVGLISLFEFLLVYAYILLRGGKLHHLRLATFRLKSLLKVAPAYAGYFVALLAITQITSNLLSEEVINQEQDIGFTAPTGSIELLVIFLALVIVAPIIEEIVFRGFMYQGMIKRFGKIGAAIFSSGLFAVAHLQINVGIDTFVLGLASCWLLVTTRSLWPSIGLHAFKNGIAFMLLFVANTPM